MQSRFRPGVSREKREMYKHLLIATDGSEPAERGVSHGLALANPLNARVTFVNVTEPFPIFDSQAPMAGYAAGNQFTGLRKDRATVCNPTAWSMQAAADKLGVPSNIVHVENKMPAPAILEQAKAERCDLIVVAPHGRRGLGKLLLGSQAAEVLSYSEVPVLVVR